MVENTDNIKKPSKMSEHQQEFKKLRKNKQNYKKIVKNGKKTWRKP